MPLARLPSLMLACAGLIVVMMAPRLGAQSTASGSRQPSTAVPQGPPPEPLNGWVDAFNSRDPARIVALYSAHAVFWGTTAQTVATTPAEIAGYFKDAGRRPDTRVTVGSWRVRFFGDIAVVSGSYTFADVKDGVTSNVRPARYSFVFHKAGDSWLIVDHHSSRVPEP